MDRRGSASGMAMRWLGIGSALAILAAGPAAGQKGGEFDLEALCTKNYQTGLEFFKNQRYIDAKESFMAVVEACPDRMDAHQQLGRVALNLREYPQAIESFEKALSLEPDNVDILNLLAYSYSASGDLDRAVDMYEDVLEKDPTRGDALQNLAYIYDRQGNKTASLMLEMRALSLSADTSSMEFPEPLAQKFLQAKVFPQAFYTYKARADASPDDVASQRILAYFYYKMDQYDLAAATYGSVLEKEPESSSAMNERKLMAEALKKAGKADQAAAIMEDVLTQEGGSMNTYYSLGSTYADMGQFDKAVAIARKGLAQDPGWGCLHYLIGDVLDKRAEAALSAKNFESAISLYEQAKGEFQAASGDPQCGKRGSEQIARHDVLIDRAQKLREKEAQK